MLIKNENCANDESTHQNNEVIENEQTEDATSKANTKSDSFKLKKKSSFTKFKKENSIDSNTKMLATSLPASNENNKNPRISITTDSNSDTTTFNTYLNSINTSSTSKRFIGKKNNSKLTPSSSNNLLLPPNLQ